MSKQGKIEAAAPAGAAAVAQADDILALARPVARARPKQEMVFSAGHNVVLDLTKDDRITFTVARGELWDQLYTVEPGPKSKSKLATQYLARTLGAMYGSLEAEIDGRKCWVKLEIQLAKPKEAPAA